MSTGFEANLLNFGGLNFSGLKVEINVGGSTKSGAAELTLPFRQSSISPSPIGLLSWHIRSSAFVGRKAEMATLAAWCEHPATLAVRFIVGAGGIGKSRLAAELALDRRRARWNAGFLDLSRSVHLPDLDKPRLLIIDYPEERGEALQTLLFKLAAAEMSCKVRVICLCRTLAKNWAGWLADSRLADFCSEPPVELGSLSIGPAKQLYDSASESMAENLGIIPLPVSDEAFEAWFTSDSVHSSPIYLMAAAMHSCLEPNDVFIRFGGRKSIMALVQRERDRLRRASLAEKLDPEALAQALAVAVLQGGLKWSTLPALGSLGSLKGLADHHAALEAVAFRLEEGVSLGAPDVVEACFLSETLALCGHPGDLVWLASATRPTPLERVERLASDAVSVMGGRSRLIEAILANLDVPDRYRSYLHGIAVRRADTLDPVLLPVVEGMWRGFARREPDRFARSGALNNVGLALGDQGRHAEAVCVLERAIKLQKASGAPLGRDWDRELSVKLLNLGRSYLDLGKPWPAAKALREAAVLQSRIVQNKDPEVALLWWSDRAQLWMIYSNLGRALSLMKDGAGAVTAFEAAVALLTESLTIHPERATQTDITVFGNYANHLFSEGKIDEAVALLQRTEFEMRLRQRDTGTPGAGFVGTLINKIGYALYGHTSGHRRLSHKELGELEAEANQVIELCKRMVAVSPGLRNLLSVMEASQSEIGRLLAAKAPVS